MIQLSTGKRSQKGVDDGHPGKDTMSMRGPRHVSASKAGPQLDVRVRATPDAVSQIRQALGGLDLPSALMDDARLLTSELVTNSIEHAGLQPMDQIRIRASWSGTRLRVDVDDGGSAAGSHPLAGSIKPVPGAESGWGLYLVDRMASRWGTASGRYWFELEVEPGTGARTA
jgi:anti-sigma regulatory factor (Ser/Thr protein kinase)